MNISNIYFPQHYKTLVV